MANYNINDVHKHILRIAKTLHSVCQEHNLRYYIWAGTMIGAIRHKGFIPWDDDIDIAMPRADYNLLIKNAKQWLPQPFEFVCAENNIHCHLVRYRMHQQPLSNVCTLNI